MANIPTQLNKEKSGIRGSMNRGLNAHPRHEEGGFTSTVESQTSKVPSITWLGLAVGSMVGSAVLLATSERKDFANFVGLWAPSFLLIGIYNKLVKLEGSDRFNKDLGAVGAH